MRSEVVVPGGGQRDYYTIKFPHPAVGVIARRGNDVTTIQPRRDGRVRAEDVISALRPDRSTSS